MRCLVLMKSKGVIQCLYDCFNFVSLSKPVSGAHHGTISINPWLGQGRAMGWWQASVAQWAASPECLCDRSRAIENPVSKSRAMPRGRV